MQNLFRSLISESGARAEHLLSILARIDLCDLGQSKTGHLITRRAGRRSEQQRIGNNRGHHETRNILRNLNVILMEHRINNCACTADRLTAEKYRIDSLNCTDSVVIDDFHDLSLLQIVDSLRKLGMVDQNDMLFLCTQQIRRSDHSDILTLIVHDRIGGVAQFAHRLANIIHEIIFLEAYNAFFCHQVLDRNSLVDQTSDRICVKFRRNDCSSR